MTLGAYHLHGKPVEKSDGMDQFSIWSTYILHAIHLMLRQAKSFCIYAEKFHPGGWRKMVSAPYVLRTFLVTISQLSQG